MNSLMVIKQFEGKTVHTFVWNGRLCWIAGEIAEVLGYEDPSATIKHFIEAEEFDMGVEYDVLKGNDLKKSTEIVNVATEFNSITNKTRHLTIFHEEGLYGFLNYSNKLEGKRFRKWIRRDVVPEIRKTGKYELPGRKEQEKITCAEVEMQKIKIKQANLLLNAAKDFQNILSPESIQLLVCKATEIVTGVPLLPLPETEKTYSAEDIGKEVGLSANMIGKLAKTERPQGRRVREMDTGQVPLQRQAGGHVPLQRAGPGAAPRNS